MPRRAVLVDFDGTASLTDVGGLLLNHFTTDTSWKVIDNDYLNGRVGSRTAYRMAEPLLRHDPSGWLRYALQQARLDPGLVELAALCSRRGWLLEILSDGLEFYIQAVLDRAGLRLPVRANQVSGEDGRVHIRTPHMNPLCGRCGTCKSARVGWLRQRDIEVVYVGDGFSDLCAAPEADLLFAKGVLADDCRARGVQHLPFDSLCEVTRALL